MSEPLLVARGLVKSYTAAAGIVRVLQGVELDVSAGEMVAIVGASGVGKSTLLHVLGTLDRPDAGSLRIAGEDVLALPEARRCAFRNRTLGFVFQFHHLLPEFSALENVAMPLLIGGARAQDAQARASALLAEVGLDRAGRATGPARCRVASSSVSRWRGPSPARRRHCWRTSPPATSTGRPGSDSTRRCASSAPRARSRPWSS